MRTAESLAPSGAQSLSWPEIRELYPNEWVCLAEIDCSPNGAIRSARVVSHDPAIERALDLVDPPDRDATVVHTSGRPLWTPRIETVD